MKTAIGKLKIDKTPGPDGIPNEVIKIVGDTWPELLPSTFNICLEGGTFPDTWKKQKLCKM